MKRRDRKVMAARKRNLERRLDRRNFKGAGAPIFSGGNIAYEMAVRVRAVGCGGIGAIHTMVQALGLDKAINDALRLLKIHAPYFESDHVLNLAYNILTGGDCVEDIEHLRPGMLCLADRLFFGYALWNQAHKTGADLLWRVKKNLKLPCLKPLPDGSYLSKCYPSEKDRRHDRNGIVVRVIRYRLDGVPDAEPQYRVITTILDPEAAPAPELAALYHERWEIETALDELKTHLRGARIVLRSIRPDLVEQEFYGFMLLHFAIRGLMHEAALKADVDPDRLSYIHAVRVLGRKLAMFVAFSPSDAETAKSLS